MSEKSECDEAMGQPVESLSLALSLSLPPSHWPLEGGREGPIMRRYTEWAAKTPKPCEGKRREGREGGTRKWGTPPPRSLLSSGPEGERGDARIWSDGGGDAIKYGDDAGKGFGRKGRNSERDRKEGRREGWVDDPVGGWVAEQRNERGKLRITIRIRGP